MRRSLIIWAIIPVTQGVSGNQLKCTWYKLLFIQSQNYRELVSDSTELPSGSSVYIAPFNVHSSVCYVQFRTVESSAYRYVLT